MNRLMPLGLTVLLGATGAAAASAQVSKTLTGETRTMKATVESIESSTRAVTVKKSNGPSATASDSSSKRRATASKER